MHVTHATNKLTQKSTNNSVNVARKCDSLHIWAEKIFAPDGDCPDQTILITRNDNEFKETEDFNLTDLVSELEFLLAPLEKKIATGVLLVAK